MPSEFKLLPGEPILLQTMAEDFDYRVDTPRDLEQITRILEEQTRPIYYIIDVTHMKMGLDDLMAAASGATRQAEMFKHPKLLETLVITQSRMFDLAARGLSSPIFGGIKMRVFPTLNEALAYARKNASMRDAI
jgi:hypothetical protein